MIFLNTLTRSQETGVRRQLSVSRLLAPVSRKSMSSIVTIGGGTGTFTLLLGLKELGVELTAIVAMSDNGGSTGRLRTELGVLPPGDVRQALVALSQEEKLMLDLFNYRFSGNGSLAGHNFGNLFLSALNQLTGDFQAAVEVAQRILRVQGKVIPVTTEACELAVKLKSGEKFVGENVIDDEPPAGLENAEVQEIALHPQVSVTPEAVQAILEADLIVLGPGDFWGSILANLIVAGVPEALQKTKARKALVLNLMTRWGQRNFKASDYVSWIRKYTPLDLVLINDAILPDELVAAYAKDHEYPILDDLQETDLQVVHGDFLSEQQFTQNTADSVKRSLLRHDSKKLAKAMGGLLKNNRSE